MSPTTDAALIERVARGDPDALTPLIERHWRWAHGLAAGLLADADAAEDAVQEACCDLVRNAGRFERERSFRGWFRSFVINRARTLNRSRSRRVRHEAVAAERVERARSAEDLALADVTRLLASLPEDLRQPLVLHYVDGCTHREVAEALGCPTGTASSRIRRGLGELERVLVAGGYGALAPIALLERLQVGDAAPAGAGEAARLELSRSSPRTVPGVPPLAPAGRAPLIAGALALAALVGTLVLLASGPGAAPEQDVGAGPPPAPPVAPAPAAATSRESGETRTETGSAPRDEAPAATAAVTTAATTATLVLALTDDLGQPLPGGVAVEVVPVRQTAEGDWIPHMAFADGRELVPVTASPHEDGTLRAEVLTGEAYAFRVEVPGHDALARAYAQRLGKDERQVTATSTLDGTSRSESVSGADVEAATRFLPGRVFLAPPLAEPVVVSGPGLQRVAVRVPRLAPLAVTLAGPAGVDLTRLGVAFTLDRAVNQTWQAPHMKLTAEGAGRTLLLPGATKVRVTGPGIEPLEREVLARPGEPLDLHLVVASLSRRLEGRVLGPAGEPVPGAGLSLGTQQATSDPEGRYALLCDAAGPGRVRVTAAGYLTTELETPAVADVLTHDLRLSRGGAVRLRALRPDGSPWAGAELCLSACLDDIRELAWLDVHRVEWSDRSEVIENPGGLGRWSSSGRSSLNGGPSMWQAQGTADEAGWLTFSGLPPGRYRLHFARETSVLHLAAGKGPAGTLVDVRPEEETTAARTEGAEPPGEPVGPGDLFGPVFGELLRAAQEGLGR